MVNPMMTEGMSTGRGEMPSENFCMYGDLDLSCSQSTAVVCTEFDREDE